MMTLLGSSLGLCPLLLRFFSHTPPFTDLFSLSLSYAVHTQYLAPGECWWKEKT